MWIEHDENARHRRRRNCWESAAGGTSEIIVIVPGEGWIDSIQFNSIELNWIRIHVIEFNWIQLTAAMNSGKFRFLVLESSCIVIDILLANKFDIWRYTMKYKMEM